MAVDIEKEELRKPLPPNMLAVIRYVGTGRATIGHMQWVLPQTLWACAYRQLVIADGDLNDPKTELKLTEKGDFFSKRYKEIIDKPQTMLPTRVQDAPLTDRTKDAFLKVGKVIALRDKRKAG